MKKKKIAVRIDCPEKVGAAKLSKMSKSELRKLAKDPRIRKHIDPVIQREKAQRRSKRLMWWENNWIAIASMAISLVSMLISLIALLK